MIALLGVIAAIAFVISGAPLAWSVFKTSKLEGFSRVGWAALFVAVVAITIQLFTLHASPVILTAQVFNVGVVGFVGGAAILSRQDG